MSHGVSSNEGSWAIRFNTAVTSGFPVLMIKSAIITPKIVVTGAKGISPVAAEMEATGLDAIAGAVNVEVGTGVGLILTGL